MAKVSAPLLSLKATGSFGKTLLFSDAKHFCFTHLKKRLSKIKRLASTDQAEVRSVFSAGVLAWNNLTLEEKESYNLLAQPLNLTGYNYFLSEFIHDFDIPTIILGEQTQEWDSEMDMIFYAKVTCEQSFHGDKIFLPLFTSDDANSEQIQTAIYSDNGGTPGTLLASSNVLDLESDFIGVKQFTIDFDFIAGNIYWLAAQNTKTTEFDPFIYLPFDATGMRARSASTGMNNWPENPVTTARTRIMTIWASGKAI